MTKKIIVYGVALALFTLSLKLLEYKLVIINHSMELYGGALALVFTVAGIYMGNRLTRKKEVIVEKTVYVPETVIVNVPAEPVKNTEIFIANDKLLEKLGISRREHEILQLMAQGCSNQEIADKAFVSVSTVKTHISNLFVKLDVSRRTQAVNKARELHLVP